MVRFLTALLAAAVVVVLAGGWTPPAARAQLPVPIPTPAQEVPGGTAVAETPPPPVPPRHWWEPGNATSCGRAWCSEVVLPYLPMSPREERIDLAVAPSPERSVAEARVQAELRSQIVLMNVRDLLDRLKQQISERKDPKPDLSEPPDSAWLFWRQKPLHPLTPLVEVGVENDQTVIYVVGDPDRSIEQRSLVTVTETDAEQAGKDIPQLAKVWRENIRRQVSNGIWGIAFDQRHPSGRTLLVLAALATSALAILAVSRLDRSLDGIRRRVVGRLEMVESSAREQVMIAFGGGDLVSSSAQLAASLHQNPAVLRQAVNLLRLLRRLLLVVNLAAVISGVVLALAVFPASRHLALYLTGQAIVLPLVWMGVMVLQPVVVVVVDHLLARWGRAKALMQPESNRYELRITTYSKVLRLAVNFFCLLIGLYATVVLLGIDPAVLAGASLVAVAIGFLTRNLLEDMVNGALILFTDRFAIGDVITVGDRGGDRGAQGGLVEDMNLHVTSLRGSDGQLTTVPNRYIDVVDNLTQRWSRVDFTVLVASDADPRRALAVIEAEAGRMWKEPEWHDLLTEAPSVLGIDEITHAGTLIRVWISTRPLKQWVVGRQFRLRIKLALAEEGIGLGMPQRRVYLLEGSGNRPATSP